MVRKVLALSLLAMLLAAPNAPAQTAPAGAPQAAASAVDPASIQALKDMGAFLQTLKRFRVSTELTGERVLADGQKLQHTATADMDVERPNKLRALMHSARSERELFYDGKTVTLYTPAQKYYSTVEFFEHDRRADRPAGAEVWRGTPAVGSLPLGHAGRAARQDRVGDECRAGFHRRRSLRPLRLSPGRVSTGRSGSRPASKPLPRKIVITNRADEARPQSVSLIDWNLKPTFKDTMFKFTPPKGATKIEIVPVKTK